MSKKLPLTILLLILMATPAMASLQCTIQCLAENQSCDEGSTICAMLFEVCMDLCDNPPVFELITPTDSSSEPLLFLAEPWFARPAASTSCQTVSN